MSDRLPAGLHGDAPPLIPPHPKPPSTCYRQHPSRMIRRPCSALYQLYSCRTHLVSCRDQFIRSLSPASKRGCNSLSPPLIQVGSCMILWGSQHASAHFSTAALRHCKAFSRILTSSTFQESADKLARQSAAQRGRHVQCYQLHDSQIGSWGITLSAYHLGARMLKRRRKAVSCHMRHDG